MVTAKKRAKHLLRVVRSEIKNGNIQFIELETLILSYLEHLKNN